MNEPRGGQVKRLRGVVSFLRATRSMHLGVSDWQKQER